MAFPIIKSSIVVALLGSIGGGIVFGSGLFSGSQQTNKPDKKTF